jgi:hypothetical protein
MVKNILIYIYLLLTVSCVRPNIQSDIILIDSVSPSISVTTTDEEPSIDDFEDITQYECLMETSDEFIGVTEKGGNNRDFTNKELKQMLVDAGWKSGLAWCSFMVKGLLDHCDIPNNVTGWSPTSYNKKDVIYTNGEFKQKYKNNDVLVMSLSYNKFKNDKSRYKAIGHTGIIEKVRETNVITREGNTGDDGGRDGDGFYKKVRPLSKNLHITRYGIKN